MSRGLGLEVDAKFVMFDKTFVLFWYLVGTRVSEDV
jgi:hypothetical protein